MKRLLSAVLAAAMLFVLASCGTDNPSSLPDPDAESVPPVSTQPTPEPTPTPAPYSNPISGEPMDEDISANRPWAIMINNLEQACLSAAYPRPRYSMKYLPRAALRA